MTYYTDYWLLGYVAATSGAPRVRNPHQDTPDTKDENGKRVPGVKGDPLKRTKWYRGHDIYMGVMPKPTPFGPKRA